MDARRGTWLSRERSGAGAPAVTTVTTAALSRLSELSGPSGLSELSGLDDRRPRAAAGPTELDRRRAGAVAALAEKVQAAADLRDEVVTDLLPAPAPLAALFPAGGLRRGSSLAVTGSTSLLFAVLAAVSAGGSWCAIVGLPTLGAVAAAEAGVAMERLALVPEPGPDLAGVVGALVDGVDLVVVGAPAGLAPAEIRRLCARARQRGAVLVGVGEWPGADLRLSLVDAVWQGAGQGDGHLRQRRVTVQAEGRGSAARPRRVVVLLPAADGRIAVPVKVVPSNPVPVPVVAGPSAVPLAPVAAPVLVSEAG